MSKSYQFPKPPIIKPTQWHPPENDGVAINQDNLKGRKHDPRTRQSGRTTLFVRGQNDEAKEISYIYSITYQRVCLMFNLN
jgi:hypothetical protein